MFVLVIKGVIFFLDKMIIFLFVVKGMIFLLDLVVLIFLLD